ncbi:TPA: phage terminase small subunit [Escherichia coli]|nr:terminase [Escherichia coli]
MSLFREHQRRVEAAQELKAGNVEAVVASPNSLHVQIAALRIDVEHLRSHSQQRADRIAMKRDVLLPKWMPWAERYLESGDVFNNPVFSYCIIWLFDTGELGQALEWAEIAIEQGQETPENIRSDFAHFAADYMLEWAETEADNGRSVEPYFSAVSGRVLEHWKVNEFVRAKYLRFAALQLLRDEDGMPSITAISDVEKLKEADALLAQATEVNPRIQVTTLRNKIAQRLRKLAQSE